VLLMHFFFSSRRRHTIFSRDWSSDVCSSDLIKRDLDSMPEAKSEDFEKRWYVDQDLITRRLKPFHPTIINRGRYPNGLARGRVEDREERRVGKERTARGGTCR